MYRLEVVRDCAQVAGYVRYQPESRQTCPQDLMSGAGAVRRIPAKCRAAQHPALREESTDLAGRIARATGCRVLSETFAARMQRGAGRFGVERLQYFAEQESGPTRWEPLTRPGQIGLFLMYRQSQTSMSPENITGKVTFEDPFPVEGDIRMTLGLQGRLLYFVAEPPFVDHSRAPPSPYDWSRLFAAAGLDMADFEPIDPTVQPPVFADTRAFYDAGNGRDRLTGIEGCMIRLFIGRCTRRAETLRRSPLPTGSGWG